MSYKHSKMAAVFGMALVLATTVQAQTTTPDPGKAKEEMEKRAKAEADAQEEADKNAKDNAANFFNGWSVGLAVIKPKVRSISDATIVDKIVRVNSEAQQEASILVSRHFYPFNNNRSCGEIKSTTEGQDPGVLEIIGKRASRCLGLMVGVGLGTAGGSGAGQLINFAGMGITIGGGVAKPNTTNWQFGFGIGRKFNVKVLGDDFKEGMAPPGTETQVRYKTIDTEAQFIYFSTSW